MQLAREFRRADWRRMLQKCQRQNWANGGISSGSRVSGYLAGCTDFHTEVADGSDGAGERIPADDFSLVTDDRVIPNARMKS